MENWYKLMDKVIDYSVKYGVLPSEAMNIFLPKEKQRQIIKHLQKQKQNGTNETN